jgi:plasmid replication initiation protein
MSIIKHNNSDIVKRTFNLTSVFADIKSEHGWTTNEVKIVLMLFEQISKHAVYLPDFKEDEYQGIIDSAITTIPTIYEISTDIFKDITGIATANLSREINKIRKGLSSKVMHLPHPLKSKCQDSGVSRAWFTDIDYLNGRNTIILELNQKILVNLVAFVKYSKVSFEYISKLKNPYSIHTYLTLKILKDSSYKGEVILKVDEYKEKLGIKTKYIMIRQFEDRVLIIIKKEINKFTDINLDYKLIKEGRSFNKIKFTFDYKPEYLEKKAKSKSKQQKIPQMIENAKADNYDSPFEHILTGWNIRARKVVELEETYSLEVIQQAIDLTLAKEKTGEIKTTKAAIFLGILENKQLASDEQFERAKNDLEQQQDKQLREQVSAEYDSLNSFILSNQDIIQSALTSNTKHLPITDKDAIPVFKKLKSTDADKFRAYTVPILNFYHFETNSNVSSTLSDIVDRSQYIEIETYKDDMAIVQAYKKALDKIKEDKYITDDQKDTLRKEVQESINILLGL